MDARIGVVHELTLDAVVAEVLRAHALHGPHSMLAPEMSPGEKLAILVEEVGEVAKECLGYFDGAEKGNEENLERELIQVAAMSISWLESLYAKEK